MLKALLGKLVTNSTATNSIWIIIDKVFKTGLNLVVVDARVDGGPMFKRIRPRARGMAYVVKKRMSHIHVELEDFDRLMEVDEEAPAGS